MERVNNSPGAPREATANTRSVPARSPETRDTAPNRPTGAAAAPATTPRDGARLSNEPRTDRGAIQGQARSRYQEFRNGAPGTSSPVVAGASRFVGQGSAPSSGQPSAPNRAAAQMNRGAPPAQPTQEQSAVSQTGETVQEAGGLAGDLNEIRARSGVRGRFGRILGAVGRTAGHAGRAAELGGAALQTPGAASRVGQSGVSAGDVLDTAGTVGTAAETGSLAANALTRSRTRRRAQQSFRQSAPRASAEVTRAASRRAAAHATSGATQARTQSTTWRAARQAAQRAPGTFAQNVGEPGRRAADRALRGASRNAAQTALDFVATSRLARAGRVLGRAVPGLNVLSAGADIRTAYNSWNDPNASTGRRIADTLTAAGSTIAVVPTPWTVIGGLALQGLGAVVGWFSG